jgi:O-antigen ligase
MTMISETAPAPRKTLADQGLLLSAAAAGLFSLISISAMQALWAIAALFWFELLAEKKRRFEVPDFFWPLLVYAGWSLLAAAASTNQAASLAASRKMLIFLIVPIIPAAFPNLRSLKLPVWAVFGSGLVASGYALAYFAFKARGASEPVRIRGFMGHYMTQAGLLGLFLALALALAVFGKGKPRFAWAAVLVPAGAALMATLTRNAWIGVGAALIVVLALWNPKALILVPVLAGLLYLAGPPAVKSRVRSIFDRTDNSNIARLEYARAGLKIIGERPLFGTGPNTVHVVFQDPRYGLGDYARHNVHLHNNFLQIAAERGVPGLLAWLAFLGWAAASLLRRFKNETGGLKALAAAGLAALAALVTAGFFEYNFGDSEVALFFLLIITLPFAGRQDGATR